MESTSQNFAPSPTARAVVRAIWLAEAVLCVAIVLTRPAAKPADGCGVQKAGFRLQESRVTRVEPGRICSVRI
jgi:hypothetical protein